jgi:hypothetical protein
VDNELIEQSSNPYYKLLLSFGKIHSKSIGVIPEKVYYTEIA